MIHYDNCQLCLVDCTFDAMIVDGKTVGWHCPHCHQLQSLGPANDSDPNVAIEIRAAELADPTDVEHPLPTRLKLVEGRGFTDYQSDNDEPDYSGHFGERIMRFGWCTGWLCAAIVNVHDAEVQS